MLQYLKRQAMKLRSGLTKGIVLLLCLATLFSSAQLGGLALIAEAADGDTVTVTVNYVYKSNSAMVAQPYTAQIAKGAAFQKTIEVPYLFNYSIPYDQAVGLGSGIKLEKNTASNKYSLRFELPAVNKDITVNLYYVAGQAQYTVKHYYQNLENDEYTFGREVELTGDIDAYTNAVADSKPGFVCLGVPQTTVAADGTTVVEIYYDREYYTVTFDVNGGIDGPEPIHAKYGTTFDVSEVKEPKRTGYQFLGWSPELTGTVTIEKSVTYVAQWEAEKEHVKTSQIVGTGVKGDDKIDGRFYLYAIKVSTPDGKAPLDGSVVTEATEQYAQRGATAEVSMTMNAEGTQEWSRMTGENIGKCIAIVLDGYVYSAPRVNSKIDKGQSQITGDFTIQEAKDLANVLNSGKVPAPAKIIQDTVVGPSLGQESINAGMISFVIAFILVLLYMGLFYKTAGWMSDVALLTNVFLLMGVLVSFGAVLTLPGIAGIVLTMGMAVDANVIIYERIKEELRGGKGLSLAIKDGFSKAYSAIIDGNLTTIITGIVLFIFGNGPVQGFATTLIIGIITSFFSAVFITRLLIEWIVARWGHISFSRKWSENFLNNTHFDFIRVRKVGYTIAVVLIALSCISFVARGLNLGAEFTGGRAYVIRFDKAVSAEEVRQNLGEAFSQHAGADASAISFEVKQYGNENQMRIVTQYRYDDTSDEATAEVEQIIFDALKPLYSYDISFEQFRNTQTDVNGILTADKIGPSIAKDMTWNAIYSVLFSLIAIGLYITFRFKRWQWASGATLALAVNALFIIGLFSMLYGFVPFNLEVNQAFIAAILTIIGYAINDTVVVFDRIREYLGLYPKRNLKDNVNNAINSTLSRTINTSGTTLVTLLAIFFFGGETIRGFIFALTVGVIVGTVATIFIATPVAYDLMAKRAKIDKE